MAGVMETHPNPQRMLQDPMMKIWSNSGYLTYPGAKSPLQEWGVQVGLSQFGESHILGLGWTWARLLEAPLLIMGGGNKASTQKEGWLNKFWDIHIMRKFIQLKKQWRIRNIQDDSNGLHEVLLNEKTIFQIFMYNWSPFEKPFKKTLTCIVNVHDIEVCPWVHIHGFMYL